jgi:NTE family protein
MLSAIGATERRGAALASYLLFESTYPRALIELGQIDTLNRRDEVLRFFGLDQGDYGVIRGAEMTA